jgi:YidC/Oxa1 family membrane protein insertase
MDIQRYLLIGTLAVLSFMLLTEWVQFKEQNNSQISSYQQQANPNTGADDIAISSSIIDTGSANTEVDMDIPSMEPAAVSSSVEESNYINVNKVKVNTDSLEVEISTAGGDIIFAALTKHYAKIDNPDIPFTLLEQSNIRTYIAQSGLIGTNGIDTSKGRAQYTSSKQQYQLEEGKDELLVDLTFQQDADITIIKRFRFTRGTYLIGVEYLITNNSEKPWVGGMFGQLKRDNTADPGADTSGMGMAPYLGAAIHLVDEPYKKISFDEISEKKFKKTSLEGGWVAIVQHYFTSAWIPAADQTHSYSMVASRDEMNIVRFTSPQITVKPNSTEAIKSQLYVGPKDQYSLKEISPGLELTVDYGILWWIAQPLFWILTKLYSILGNWGFAIIAVTVLVKAAFFQLNAKAYTSMANMRKVQPKLVSIRERYADDKAKQSQEMMALYKKEKINPLGGCLPILVQMPVFIALYWVLMESVELRHAPFIGYIKDLSVMDPYFILPLIMGVSMFIQQKLNPPPPDPMQAKVMQWMPVMFTFFFLFFPAGLVLYWVVNNTLSIAQQYIITKRIENS